MGYLFVCDYGGVLLDIYLFGKIFGGGVVLLLVMVVDCEIFGVVYFGEYGLMFGGNLLVVVIGIFVVFMVVWGEC